MITHKKGFTLIELMVVISIISVMSSIILVSLNTARTKARFGAAQQFSSSMYQSFGASAFAHWSFDDSSSLGADSSGNNLNFTLNGGPVAISDGAIRGAIRFDGVNDYVSVNTAVGSSLRDINKNGGTISLWVRPLVANQSLLFFNGISNQGVRMYLSYESGQPVFTRGVGANPYKVYQGQKTNVGEWHHMALSWTSSNVMSAYYDGVRIGGGSYTGPTSGESLLTIEIAKHTYTDSLTGAIVNLYFNGDIDEVLIHSGVLSDSEIHSLYLAGLEEMNQNFARK